MDALVWFDASACFDEAACLRPYMAGARPILATREISDQNHYCHHGKTV